MDEIIEEMSSLLCMQDDKNPDENVEQVPVGPLMPQWRLYEPGARWLIAGLLLQAMSRWP